MKIFGKDLFNFKKDPTILYDFAQHGILENNTFNFVTVEEMLADETTKKKSKKKKKVTETIQLTPKGVYHLKSLNENDFRIKGDPKYISEQISDAKDKLELLGKEKKEKTDNGIIQVMGIGAVHYGREELKSIIQRLENRLMIDTWGEMLEKYPHTSNQKIGQVLKDNTNLRCKKADIFVPDFPKEAVKAMQEYNDACVKLCNQKTHFYVIAQQKDFEKTTQRRDPILLAQSPFGFFWQILGAWDDEMIYLGDL